MDDFAGTGYFTREYVNATKYIGPFKSTIGIGWGKYAGKNSFKNPLHKVSNSLLNNYNSGGSLSYDQWFRGDASFFGGIEYRTNLIRGLTLKLEYDPFDYYDFSASNRLDAKKSIRDKDSNINFGTSYQYNDNVTIDVSYIKGNTFNLSFNYSYTFDEKSVNKPTFKPLIETKYIN